jgi:hypothetical protein
MATVPPQVKALLQALPRRWDEVRFLAGEPGKHLVLARRAGQQWFVAGFNAETSDKTVTLDLSFLKGREAELIGDGDGPRDFRVERLAASTKSVLTMKQNGGFVARFK